MEGVESSLITDYTLRVWSTTTTKILYTFPELQYEKFNVINEVAAGVGVPTALGTYLDF